MENKNCSICSTEKHINKFNKKLRECKICNTKIGLNRDHENKDKTSNQRKIYYEQIKKN